MGDVQDFNEYRKKMNERIPSKSNKVLSRLFNMDSNADAQVALLVLAKEMLGLVASLVLTCDDWIKYHVQRCYEVGSTQEELFEGMAIENVVGGTILIPHTRRATRFWDALVEENT